MEPARRCAEYRDREIRAAMRHGVDGVDLAQKLDTHRGIALLKAPELVEKLDREARAARDADGGGRARGVA